MKFPFFLLAALAATASLTGEEGSPAVAYFGHDKVAGALATGGTLMTASDYKVMGNTRTANGHPELHEKETDIFYVVDGEATFVTGGKMLGGKTIAPGQVMGTEIVGGQVHHLAKGDVIVIPAGVPHWYKEVPHAIAYFAVKVLKP